MQKAAVELEIGGYRVYANLEAHTPADLRAAIVDFIGVTQPEAKGDSAESSKPPQRRPRKPKTIVVEPEDVQIALTLPAGFSSEDKSARQVVEESHQTALAPIPTKQDIVEAIVNFARTSGYDAALKLIRKFNKEDGTPADKAGEIRPENYLDVLRAITAYSPANV